MPSSVKRQLTSAVCTSRSVREDFRPQRGGNTQSRRRDEPDYRDGLQPRRPACPALPRPTRGVTLAEFLLDKGMDVLIVYDDLSKHADTYREMSPPAARPPGREAYPKAIFSTSTRVCWKGLPLNEEREAEASPRCRLPQPSAETSRATS